MKKQSYYVVFWDAESKSNHEIADDHNPTTLAESYATLENGGVIAFKDRFSLSKWLSFNQAAPHFDDHLASQNMLQLADGRDCMVIMGRAKALKRQVSVI